jgi:hypothetical protein
MTLWRPCLPHIGDTTFAEDASQVRTGNAASHGQPAHPRHCDLAPPRRSQTAARQRQWRRRRVQDATVMGDEGRGDGIRPLRRRGGLVRRAWWTANPPRPSPRQPRAVDPSLWLRRYWTPCGLIAPIGRPSGCPGPRIRRLRPGDSRRRRPAVHPETLLTLDTNSHLIPSLQQEADSAVRSKPSPGFSLRSPSGSGWRSRPMVVTCSRPPRDCRPRSLIRPRRGRTP